MQALPRLAPTWFPPTGCDGTSGSAIWLTWMGRIEMLLGGCYLLKHQAGATYRRLATTASRERRPAPVAMAAVRTQSWRGAL